MSDVALVDEFGDIKFVGRNIPAGVKILSTDRIVSYVRPAFDDAYFEIVAVTPVSPESTYVEFEIIEKPGSLQAAKLSQLDKVDKARLQANRGSFFHQSLEFSCDELSRSDIDGVHGVVVATQKLPQNWPGAWRGKTGQLLPISTVSQWLSFYESMIQKGTENFSRAQTLKTHINSGTSVAEVLQMPTW